jgi:hypothetical protein
MNEQRAHPRFRVDLTATFSNRHKTGLMKIGNISRGGCGVESHVEILPGDVGQLLIDVPGGTASLKVSQASVKWVTGKESGLKFMHIGPDDQEGLDRFTNQLAVHAS